MRWGRITAPGARVSGACRIGEGGHYSPMSFVPGEPIEAVREKVVSALSLHFANDRLTLEELEHRLGMVYSAKTSGELSALLADLPTGGVLAPAPQVSVAAADEVPASKTIVAIMSEVKRRGAWVLPRELQVYALMGNARLDLRAATFPAGVTTINAWGLMADITIIVPPDVGVEADGTSIMGSIDAGAMQGTRVPGHPTVRIQGYALMASIHVKVRAVGEK